MKLLGLTESLKEKARPGVVAFAFYEILLEAGYSHNDVVDIAEELTALAEEP